MSDALKKIIELAIKRGVASPQQLKAVKAVVAKEYGTSMAPNSSILAKYREMINAGELEKDGAIWTLFSKRIVRNLSGVAVITVLTEPYSCPGKCVYCPSEQGMPKSYLSNEPGAARALRHQFDPFSQVEARLKALDANGHVTDKCELIVLGGSWSAYPHEYQTWFIKRCYDAFNSCVARDIEEAKMLNETAQHRVIGLTLETRPDLIDEEEVRRMRVLGCTRVQLGVQTTDEEVLQLVRREQTNEDAVRATRLLKEAGMKVSHHYMQGLPGATIEKDLKTIVDAFCTPDFQPDHIKIYPTVVTGNSVLYQWWKDGSYTPYAQESLEYLLVEIKKLVPEWVRIERLVRDIPSSSIYAGNRKTNLRQMMKRQGVQCRCIRCREPGDVSVALEDLELVRRGYDASGGREVFLSYESPDKEIMYAFARLRLQNIGKHWIPELQDAALIREVHTYGRMAKIDSGEHSVQHVGMGQQLMEDAEEIARHAGYTKIAVIAGVGVREYFRNKCGYRLEGEYMVKDI
ncbi:MAG: tRNA uridine(34) 5-carboxymethylaminomethyl modification radical SAM/GNAT enzyme Elp3 [Candidatus Kerfeldbacteria bacterium]